MRGVRVVRGIEDVRMILIVDKRDQILKFRPEYVSTEDCYLFCETRRLSVSSWGGQFLV